MSTTGKQFSVDKRSEAYWRISFSNPPINMLDFDSYAELSDLVTQIEADEALKVVVFDSADPDFFMAHFDVSRANQVPNRKGPTGYSLWIDAAIRLAQAPVLSIAAVRGRVRGGGSEFTLACDIRFGSLEKAIFGQPEVGAGLIPGGGGTERLPLLVGRARALEIVLGADDFDAATAERYGWINRAIPDAQFDAFVERYAQRIAKFERNALKLAKEVINRRTLVLPEDLDATQKLFFGTFQWPGTQEIGALLRQQGIGTRSDLELNFGESLGKLR